MQYHEMISKKIDLLKSQNEAVYKIPQQDGASLAKKSKGSRRGSRIHIKVGGDRKISENLAYLFDKQGTALKNSVQSFIQRERSQKDPATPTQKEDKRNNGINIWGHGSHTKKDSTFDILIR